MGRILVADDDRTMTMFLSAALSAAGHSVWAANEPERITALAAEVLPDVVVLDVVMPHMTGFEVLEELRKNPVTKAIPVLFLSAKAGSADRIRGLRAGANDYLTKPFEADATAIGQGRLVGDLQMHPLFEVLQGLSQSGKSGILTLATRSGNGRLELREGSVRAASFGRLHGREAAIAALALGEGQFRLDAIEAETLPIVGPEAPLSVESLLMDAAWREDEIQRRKAHVPPLDAALVPTGSALPEPPEGLAAIPFEAILTAISGGASLKDLLAREIVAPPTLTLAVAWLREVGAVSGAPEPAPDEAAAGAEDAEELDGTIRDLFQVAIFCGLPPRHAAVFVVAQGNSWESLTKLFSEVPAPLADRNRDEAPVIAEKRLKSDGGEVLTLRHELGRLDIHANRLSPALAAAADLLPEACVAVSLWLSGAGSDIPLLAFVREVERVPRELSGTLIAPDRDSQGRAEWLSRGTKRWTVVREAPSTLARLLRSMT